MTRTVRRLGPARTALAALSSVALMATLSACGGSASADEADALSEVSLVFSGALTVCTDMPYEPFEYEKGGKPTGFDIDLVREVAKDLDADLDVIDVSFDDITSGNSLNTDACDLAISAMTITGERARVVDFSSPYFNAFQTLVVDKAAEVSSLADLAGKKIAVQGGTTGELYVTDNAPKSGEVVPLKDAAAMEDALKQGRVDAAVYDNTVVGDVVAHNPALKVAANFDTGEQYGMAVKKDGNVALLRALNRALASLKQDGGYQRIYTDWFGAAG